MNVRARAYHASIILVCSLVVPLTPAAQAPTVENTIRLRVEQARQQPTVAVRGTRLMQPEAVARFFEARAFAPAWRLPAGAQEVLAAIRNIEQDGLTPTDYHLGAITRALESYAKTPSTEGAADLQVLIADAAAAMVDHVRHGRVRPASLDKRWNVDPRVGAAPLDLALEDLARAPVLDVAIESKKPTHFIYTGLKEALARMRVVAKAGGWPAVTAGTTPIKPGARDPRVEMIRPTIASQTTGWSGRRRSTP
jgi:L,D-transpeptidase YcbB